MKGPFIFLHPEVSRGDAAALIRWMGDGEVRRFLSDSQGAARDVEQAVNRAGLPVVTQLFCRGGRFYLICKRPRTPVGFVRLIHKGTDWEIVIAIGERESWNRKWGTAALKESLKAAFFELRAGRVVAKIHKDNIASARAFASVGFAPMKKRGDWRTYTLTMGEYLNRIKGGADMGDITITDLDRERITKLLNKLEEDGASPDESLKALAGELSRAVIVDSRGVPGDVITMNTRAVLGLDGEEMEVSLAYPGDADVSENRISLFSPIGTAILGYREGSTIRWQVPGGQCDIHIKKIVYQPEAAGDYHL